MGEYHYEWLQRQLKYPMSDFGRDVAQIVGIVWRGIYHLQQSSFLHERTNWADDQYIEMVILDEGLATFDGARLTGLFILCHDRCVRLEINSASSRYIRLKFQRRHGRSGEIWARHPTMEDAIKNWRG